MRISATDIDDGNNSIVHYSLDSNSPDQAYFYIDPDNGVIFLNKTIDVSILFVKQYKFIMKRVILCCGFFFCLIFNTLVSVFTRK